MQRLWSIGKKEIIRAQLFFQLGCAYFEKDKKFNQSICLDKEMKSSEKSIYKEMFWIDFNRKRANVI